MAIPEDILETISSGTTTCATATLLQTLLGISRANLRQDGRVEKAAQTASKPSNRPRADRNQRTLSARTKQEVNIHEDETVVLSGRGKYALAINVVNRALKVLTQAAKDVSRPQSTSGSEDQRANGTTARRRSSPSAPDVLRPRPNNATATRRPPMRSMVKEARDERVLPLRSREAPRPDLVHLSSLAECSRLALRFLRTTDPTKLDVQKQPLLQEAGALALVEKLTVLGLEDLAWQELRCVRCRLESFSSGSQPDRKGTLASLLDLSIDRDAKPEVLQLAVTYKMHVLQLIVTSRDPCLVVEAEPKLDIEQANSPAALIMRCGDGSGDCHDVGKQLERLSSMILSLCPSVSISADENAQSISPTCALRLQTLALKVRRLVGTLPGCSTKSEQDTADAFSKMVAAYMRRNNDEKSPKIAYAQLQDAYDSLWGPNTATYCTPGHFTVYMALSKLAERASLLDQAERWTGEAVTNCRTLGMDHARHLTAITRRATLSLYINRDGDAPKGVHDDVKTVQSGLQRTSSGSTLDFQYLLAELAGFAQALHHDDREWSAQSMCLVRIAAGFASRFVIMHGERGLDSASRLVNSALAMSKLDECSSWITTDSIRVMLLTGVLRNVSTLLAYQSVTAAWSSSRVAMSLSLMLKAWALKCLHSDAKGPSVPVYDDDTLPSDERGALLERQLHYFLELSTRPVEGQEMLCDAMRKVFEAYTAVEYPIRRARVEAFLLRYHERCPGIIPPLALERYLHEEPSDREDLGHDEGLKSYAAEIHASLSICRAFMGGPPPLHLLEGSLALLQKVFNPLHLVNAPMLPADDATGFFAQLASLDDYSAVSEDNKTRIIVTRTLVHFARLSGMAEPKQVTARLRLSRAYLDSGNGEIAGQILDGTTMTGHDTVELVDLEYHIMCAVHRLTMDDNNGCSEALGRAESVWQNVKSRRVCASETKKLHLLSGKAWLLYSRYYMAIGQHANAINFAKRAVKLLNGLWTSLERSSDADIAEKIRSTHADEEHEHQQPSTGVSKLNFEPSTQLRENLVSGSRGKGASFWPIIPWLTSALTHLSAVYSSNGIFKEALYYSEQAMKIADSVGPGTKIHRPFQHHIKLLAMAGRLGDAELCLVKRSCKEISKPDIIEIEILRAESYVKIKEGSFDEALKHLTEAENHIECLLTNAQCQGESASESIEPAFKVKTKAKSQPKYTKKASSRPITTKQLSSKTDRLATLVSKQAPYPNEEECQNRCYILEKLRNDIRLDRAFLCLEMRCDIQPIISKLALGAGSLQGTSRWRQFEHRTKMQHATAALLADFSLSMLPEATLACSPLLKDGAAPFGVDAQACLVPSAVRKKSGKKSSREKGHTPDLNQSCNIQRLLGDARATLASNTSDCLLKTTAEAHSEFSLLSGVSMYLSATGASNLEDYMQPSNEAAMFEAARIHASSCLADVAQSDYNDLQASSQSRWPNYISPASQPTVTALSFQEGYVDLLPRPWRAVSLCLSETLDQLYLVRYQCNRTPFILRLPLARHKPEMDDEDEQTFDFETSKAELKDIIDMSNFSCHNSIDVSAKGAKSKWWNERQSLDHRLHELLINIENIWLGGFKGIFSQQEVNEEKLAKFRKAFEAILDRHLPSRQSHKRDARKLQLNDHILELFIGLGGDNNEATDLDEPLSDLLYFVVDMLQFNGERNAYDEIDFDNMIVDVSDALRDYHGVAELGDQDAAAHLVLILDRRLQAFPWESMPCLEGMSVSRVDSMYTLQERLLAMRALQNCKRSLGRDDSDESRVTVTRRSGSYILNPDGDLTNTESVLGPVLSRLESSQTSGWSSIVHRKPSEEDFKIALSGPTMLYFGHGAGSQYIRPRAIRRLEKCSEVVWLMGCSSATLTEHDELEPFAIPLEYMTAGRKGAPSLTGDPAVHGKCMAVLATLWDVTDRDIDRFSLAVGEDWGLWHTPAESRSLPSKAISKRNVTHAPMTPRRATQPPKTPKTGKTPARSYAPAKSHSHQGKSSLTEAVAKNRDACYLRYLNGAAPVVYGIPVYLGD